MPRVFIGVGSNIEPAENVRKALRLLSNSLEITAISMFYCTEPAGRPEQPFFYNGVVEVDTDIPPEELKHGVLREIEEKLGRIRADDKYAPRTIDLDLLVYDDLVVSKDDVTVPDPQIRERPFLAVPLYELAPDMVLPDSGVQLKTIIESFGNHNMKPLPEYSEELRKDLMDGLRES